jgi:hypothetical protein
MLDKIQSRVATSYKYFEVNWLKHWDRLMKNEEILKKP